MNPLERRLTPYQLDRLNVFAHLVKLVKVTREEYAPKEILYGIPENGVIQPENVWMRLDETFARRVNYMAEQLYNSEFARDPNLRSIANTIVDVVNRKPVETVVFESQSKAS